jgi:hypothetical protein
VASYFLNSRVAIGGRWPRLLPRFPASGPRHSSGDGSGGTGLPISVVVVPWARFARAAMQARPTRGSAEHG